jgi:hypothetical protein
VLLGSLSDGGLPWSVPANALAQPQPPLLHSAHCGRTISARRKGWLQRGRPSTTPLWRLDRSVELSPKVPSFSIHCGLFSFRSSGCMCLHSGATSCGLWRVKRAGPAVSSAAHWVLLPALMMRSSVYLICLHPCSGLDPGRGRFNPLP